jgi:multidrug efflux pump subunit AcrB
VSIRCSLVFALGRIIDGSGMVNEWLTRHRWPSRQAILTMQAVTSAMISIAFI